MSGNIFAYICLVIQQINKAIITKVALGPRLQSRIKCVDTYNGNLCKKLKSDYI